MDIYGRGCDWCKYNDREPDVAVASYTIAIDNGPDKRLDFCEAHNDTMAPLFGMYQTNVTLIVTAPEQAPLRLYQPAPGQLFEPEPTVLEAPAQLALEPAPEPAAISIPAQAVGDDLGPEFICLECDPPQPLTRKSISSHAPAKHKKSYHDVKWGGWGKLPRRSMGGFKVKGADMVVCTLPHREGTPDPYWVLFENRGSHAGGHVPELRGPEIKWDNPMGLDYGITCTEHKLCAEYDAGRGYPFQDGKALRSHIGKCKAWEKAPAPLSP